MRDRALLFVLAMSLSVAAQAQVIWQPTPVPLVTAENTSWFNKGEPVHWNGDLYYPTRPVQHFNRYQMVRTGSFNGIPLYIDPDARGRHHPVRAAARGRSRPALRASPAAAVPRGVRRHPAGAVGTQPSPRHTTRWRPRRSAVASSQGALGTDGRGHQRPDGRGLARGLRRPVTTSNPPTGVNAIWVNYDGRRWFLAGKAIDYDAATLAEVGDVSRLERLHAQRQPVDDLHPDDSGPPGAVHSAIVVGRLCSLAVGRQFGVWRGRSREVEGFRLQLPI